MIAGHAAHADVASYRMLRRVVGVLSVMLPVILAIWGFALCGCAQLQPSISDYYVLRTRDAFVGILFTVAWFLYTYRGFERKDDIAGNLACVFALGVALFPISGTRAEQIVHFTSAAALFLVLAYFSLFLFTKSRGIPSPRKLVRNRIYRVCGVAMLVCIGLIAIYHAFLSGTAVAALKPVFWLEAFATWAFGVSWFVKGDTVFKDRITADDGVRIGTSLPAPLPETARP
jgi:hypothetical protein